MGAMRGAPDTSRVGLVRHLMRRIAVSESGCWEWQSTRVGRYGTCCFGGTTGLAHRAAYTAFEGDIPDGWVIDHLCRNPLCVNPQHLQAVPQAVNIRRGRGPALTRERSRKSCCVHGHALTPDNVYEYPRGGYILWCCRACRNASHQRRRRARRGEQETINASQA
jgi:hypothetical protein